MEARLPDPADPDGGAAGTIVPMTIYTIGHSNHSAGTFIGLLRQHGVRTAVDVRTAPYSRYNAQFNREDLEAALSQHAMRYVFAGKSLGGRPADPSCYKSGTVPGEGADYLHDVDYPAVMKREWFIKGIGRLLEIASEQTTAILCSEENPTQCHRHHLIAKYLMATQPNVDVQHIRGDGTAFSARTILQSVDTPTVIQHSLF